MGERYILGIDPGSTGAAGLLVDDDFEYVTDLPVVDWMLCCNDLEQELREHMPALDSSNVFVVVERQQAMTKQGVVSTFNTGYLYGQIIGWLVSLGVPFYSVRPQVWKKAAGLIRQDKEASRQLARTLWPVSQGALKNKGHHNRAEALLIARYGLPYRDQEKEK